MKIERENIPVVVTKNDEPEMPTKKIGMLSTKNIADGELRGDIDVKDVSSSEILARAAKEGLSPIMGLKFRADMVGDTITNITTIYEASIIGFERRGK